MSKDKNILVPELRFLKFQNEQGWSEEILGNIGVFTGGGTPSRENTSYWKGHIPWISSSDISDDSIHQINISRFITDEALKNSATKQVPENSILLISRVGVGKLAVSEKSVCTSQDFTNFTPDKDNLIFLAYYLKSNNKTLLEYSQGMAIKGFTKDDVSRLKLFLPSLPEQQKIADCLSSIDDLIAAQKQKLEALQVHKKGLLQNLFPGEGETVPKLRFKEFEGDGEWEIMKFGELCKFVRGPFGGALKKEFFVKDGYAVYEQSHAIYANFDSFRYYINNEKFEELKRFSVLAGDIIMSCSGTMGKFAIVPDETKKGVINQALLKLTVKKEYDRRFIKSTLELSSNQDKLLSQSAGGAIKNVVGVSQIKEIELFIPSLKEQQKIADCLSSIDELIKAQSQKIEALQNHKKGLMQQLFPKMSEL